MITLSTLIETMRNAGNRNDMERAQDALYHHLMADAPDCAHMAALAFLGQYSRALQAALDASDPYWIYRNRAQVALWHDRVATAYHAAYSH